MDVHPPVENDQNLLPIVSSNQVGDIDQTLYTNKSKFSKSLLLIYSVVAVFCLFILVFVYTYFQQEDTKVSDLDSTNTTNSESLVNAIPNADTSESKVSIDPSFLLPNEEGTLPAIYITVTGLKLWSVGDGEFEIPYGKLGYLDNGSIQDPQLVSKELETMYSLRAQNEADFSRLDGVDVLKTGEESFMLLLVPDTEKYLLTFSATESPWLLSLRLGFGGESEDRLSMKYLDQVNEKSAKIQMEITDQNITKLLLDSDADNTYETVLEPTALLIGANNQDSKEPEIKISKSIVNSKTVLTLDAMDDKSGISILVYSLDGTTFNPYTSPFEIENNLEKIYYFADDNSGNRTYLHQMQIESIPLQ
jgi:hypothetical protein